MQQQPTLPTPETRRRKMRFKRRAKAILFIKNKTAESVGVLTNERTRGKRIIQYLSVVFSSSSTFVGSFVRSWVSNSPEYLRFTVAAQLFSRSDSLTAAVVWFYAFFPSFLVRSFVGLRPMAPPPLCLWQIINRLNLRRSRTAAAVVVVLFLLRLHLILFLN